MYSNRSLCGRRLGVASLITALLLRLVDRYMITPRLSSQRASDIVNAQVFKEGSLCVTKILVNLLIVLPQRSLC